MKTDYAVTRNFNMDKSRIIGIIFLIFFILLVITYSTMIGLIINFVRVYLSSDQSLKDVTITDIEHYYAYFIILTGALGLFILLNLHKKIRDLAVSIIDFRNADHFFLTDAASSSKQLPKYLLLISSVAGMLMVVIFSFYPRPEQEGFFETFQSILLVASAVILIIAALKSPKKIVYILISLALLFLFMFAEEISWGQRSLGYSSPEFFNEHNYQSELNIHNFFNPIYDIIYKVFGITFFTVLVLLWFFRKEKQNSLFVLFTPPASLSFLAFLMACATFGNREIFEGLFYIFLLLYSIRMYLCMKHPALSA